MKTLISRQFVAVLALLCSSIGMAATVTVNPSTLTPTTGSSFTVTLSAVDFVNMGGGTFSVTWDNSKATLTSAVLPASGPVGTGTGTFLIASRFGGQLNHIEFAGHEDLAVRLLRQRQDVAAGPQAGVKTQVQFRGSH